MYEVNKERKTCCVRNFLIILSRVVLATNPNFARKKLTFVEDALRAILKFSAKTVARLEKGVFFLASNNPLLF